MPTDRPTSSTRQEPQLWFEDFEVGQVYDLGSVVAEHDDVIAFAERFDPQWYHLDEEAAQQSSWGGLIVSGWWTASSMMRLYADNFLSKTAPDASPGAENLRWLKAVYVGDKIDLKITVAEVKDSSRGPHLGNLRLDWEASRDGVPVLTMTARGWFHRRPDDTGTPRIEV